jgi:hypothetical protein
VKRRGETRNLVALRKRSGDKRRKVEGDKVDVSSTNKGAKIIIEGETVAVGEHKIRELRCKNRIEEGRKIKY